MGSRTARSFPTRDDLNELGEARVVVVLEGPEGLSQEPRLLLVLAQAAAVEGLGRVEHMNGMMPLSRHCWNMRIRPTRPLPS